MAEEIPERVNTEVPCPPLKALDNEILFPQDGVADWRELRDFLSREGKMEREQCLTIIRKFSEVAATESTLLNLRDPITVVGDIHGQFYDMLQLLEAGGNPETTQYLFLGDYVDRGSFSMECLLLLYALKANYPQRIWLLRGNHECRQMTAYFNFRDECEVKQDLTIYQAFMDSFDVLPLAALINGKFLAVHGGISPECAVVADINKINRFTEPPRAGAFCDLLWADPADENKQDHCTKKDPFFHNDVRGCSYFFGYDAAKTFLDRNGLFAVLRAHEAQLEGFKQHRSDPKKKFPTVITIFSAPNYCDCYNNMGAILKLTNDSLDIKAFRASPHPYHLPNFMDVFSWSIPFVSEKVIEMLYSLLSPSLGAAEGRESEEEEEIDNLVVPAELAKFIAEHSGIVHEEALSAAPEEEKKNLTRERADALRKKVQSVSRLLRMFRTLRENHETVIHLKGLTPGHRIPMGVLLQGGDALQSELDQFVSIKDADQINEKRPD